MIEIANKKPANLLQMTVSELLMEGRRSSELLKILDLPIRGNEDKTLMEVCASRQMNEKEVIDELAKIKEGENFEYPAGIFNWSAELVIKYLEEEHHQYTRSLIQDAEDYENRAFEVHGTQYPELNQVKWYFGQLQEKMELHLKFEEEKFFPLSLKLLEMDRSPRDGMVQSLKKQVKLIQKDQEEIDYFITRIHKVSNAFHVPEGACTTLRLLYSTLYNLYEDLEKHHFLEEQYLLSKLEMKLQKVQS